MCDKAQKSAVFFGRGLRRTALKKILLFLHAVHNRFICFFKDDRQKIRFFTVRRAGVFGKELNAMAKNKELSFADKIWYGTGAVGLDLSYGMFYGKLNRYLTDVLNLGPGFLTVLTALARIWDGINDPMMGSIVDNSFSKRGKYRPWVMRGALLNAVVLFFLFFNPGFDTSSHGIGIYVYT